MSTKIKLQRKGTKKKPFYRIVVQDESDATDSRVIEMIGRYNPLVEPAIFEVDKEKISAWLAKGARPTDRVRILLGKAGILPPVDLASRPKRKPKSKGEEEAKPEVKAEAPKEEKKEGAPA